MKPTASQSVSPDEDRPNAGTASHGPSPRLLRGAYWVKLAALGIALIGLFMLVRQLPVERLVNALAAQVEAAGVWGPVLFGLAYVLAAVLFVPGSALTLAAGAVFGLLWGTITVSLASTTAAALAFLIARYLARNTVQRWAHQYPRFGAIDRAIREGGWKVVALLRLSPLVPYNVGNYLFGLTAVHFWPYVLASWLAMLPGTFLYVYLGYLGRAGLTAAADAQQRSVWQWVMLGVGLLATVAVTVYVTRLARRALREHAAMDTPSQSQQQEETPVRTTWRPIWTAGMALVLAVGMASFAACATLRPGIITGLFGPPQVTMHEAYQERADGPSFDHSAFDALLKRYVDEDGWVDYAALAEDAGPLDQYIAAVAEAPFDEMGRDEKLALLINAYNAFTLKLILEYYPEVKSIKDIPEAKRWEDERWSVGGHVWSLNQIEHEQIRPKFKEPRIHFALVCAAVGCPPLRIEAYVADGLDEQLADQTRYVHTHDRWFQFDPQKNVVHLTPLYDWYGGDFEQAAGSVLNFAAEYAPPLADALERGQTPQIQWLEYDWRLNSRENRPDVE